MNLESFIQSVKENECLWIPHLESYKDTHLKETVWRELAKKHNFDNVRQAKAAWKRLRDVHRGILKKRQLMRKQGITVSRKSRWLYLDQLSFLIPFITRRNAPLPKPNFEELLRDQEILIVEGETFNNEEEISNNEEETLNNYEEACNNDEETERDGITFDSIYLNDSDTGESSKKRGKRQMEFHEAMQDFEPDISVKSSENENNVVVTKFFETMSETTKKFPQYLQIEVKRKIFNIISAAEERNLKENFIN